MTSLFDLIKKKKIFGIFCMKIHPEKSAELHNAVMSTWARISKKCFHRLLELRMREKGSTN